MPGLLSSTLASLDPSVGAPGWAAFVTSDRVHESAALSTGTPTLAKWRTGAYLSRPISVRSKTIARPS